MIQDERALWTYLRKKMGSAWSATRHEDKLTAGVPDVSFGTGGVNGWIELKVVREVTRAGELRIGLRPEQRAWLLERQAHGGRCFVLAWIEPRQVLALVDARKFIDSDYDHWTFNELMQNCWHWCAPVGDLAWTLTTVLVSGDMGLETCKKCIDRNDILRYS